MRDDPIDLTPLDPDATVGAEDRFVDAVMARIATRPNPYPVQVGVLWGAWSLARPVLIAASVAIVVASIVIARNSVADDAPQTVAESVGVPPMFRQVAASSTTEQSR